MYPMTSTRTKHMIQPESFYDKILINVENLAKKFEKVNLKTQFDWSEVGQVTEK